MSQRVASHVATLPESSFVTVRGVSGPRSAVESAFSRLAASGEVARVRKGTYWKGAPTPLGVSLASRRGCRSCAIGGPGSGPAGVAAAHWLGLTSQDSIDVPGCGAGTGADAVAHRCGSRNVRSGGYWQGMSPSEVAVLEVLRSGPAVVEAGWDRLGEVVAQLAEDGHVRPAALDAAANDEPHRGARARWAELCRSRSGLVPTP